VASGLDDQKFACELENLGGGRVLCSPGEQVESLFDEAQRVAGYRVGVLNL